MKTYFSTTMYLLLLFSFSSSLSQTAITNKDYEVTDDVVKIEEYNYVTTEKNISEKELQTEELQIFKNGLLAQKESKDYFNRNSPTTRTYYYEHTIPNNEYVEYSKYVNGKKEVKISGFIRN